MHAAARLNSRYRAPDGDAYMSIDQDKSHAVAGKAPGAKIWGRGPWCRSARRDQGSKHLTAFDVNLGVGKGERNATNAQPKVSPGFAPKTPDSKLRVMVITGFLEVLRCDGTCKSCPAASKTRCHNIPHPPFGYVVVPTRPSTPLSSYELPTGNTCASAIPTYRLSHGCQDTKRVPRPRRAFPLFRPSDNDNVIHDLSFHTSTLSALDPRP
ncbi:hypothetical protein QBC34DRAFT_105316 [Podospora aff. communis PSN243]|uniref:Uncharacterized protein n=1 Tax=Podospora aff. communis PSN243 TaxID=3040156 RepID=A0AAV9H1V7_9PEZI|nr:hypothetical protein QBC34DRAFT_105316 [Podospora aff. communis PSN243]